MALLGRYYSQRDINLVNQFNAELMRDIIETLVVCFKICAAETRVNMYGEAAPTALKDANFYPEVGDFILFNDRYHEVNNVVQEQLLGGQANKSHSIICNTHYSRLSQINLVDRQF